MTGKPARLRLLEIAAKLARREYLPSLERCRTIRDARAEVGRYDDYHGRLASELKTIWDELSTETVRHPEPETWYEIERSRNADKVAREGY